ncbi:Histone H1.2 [Linum perenne]
MAETEAPIVTIPEIITAETKPEKPTPKSAAKTKAKAKAKTPNTKKSAAAPAAEKPKAPRGYPSFEEMIGDAISLLKERTGSSQIAIAKCIEDKQKKLPTNFRKLLSIQLKLLAAAENSFTIEARTPSSFFTGRFDPTVV